MTLLSPPFALGAAGQVLSGKLLRLSLGAAYRNAAAGVQAVAGCLYGPAGTMGELTLNSNTSLTVGPFRAVVQQTQDVTQGPYLVVNDASVTATTAVVAGLPTMPAQDASQFRRAYVAVYVADSQVSGVASSGVTDRSVLDILPGALAASAGVAAYPAVPANALLLGELLIPPVGQAVTLTAYNPRTTTRGGILPVIADGANRPGHDGDLGLHLGQYRDHPTHGLQRWNVTLGIWEQGGGSSGVPRLATFVGTGLGNWADLHAVPGGTANYERLHIVRNGTEVRMRGLIGLTAGQSATAGQVWVGVQLPADCVPPVAIALRHFYVNNTVIGRMDINPVVPVTNAGTASFTWPQTMGVNDYVAIDTSWTTAGGI